MILIQRQGIKSNLHELRHPKFLDSRHVLDQVLESSKIEKLGEKIKTLRRELIRIWKGCDVNEVETKKPKTQKRNTKRVLVWHKIKPYSQPLSSVSLSLPVQWMNKIQRSYPFTYGCVGAIFYSSILYSLIPFLCFIDQFFICSLFFFSFFSRIRMDTLGRDRKRH